MKRIIALMLSLSMLTAAQASGPDDQYLEIYNWIQQADGMNRSTDAKTAAGKYAQALDSLKKMQSVYPSWNPEIVKFRIEYVSDKLVEVNKLLPAQQPAAPAAQAATAPKVEAPMPAAMAELQQQIADLGEQVRGLVAEKSALEKRLKEALSVQPSAGDSKEVSRLETELVATKKEKELLAVLLEQERAAAKANASKPAAPKVDAAVAVKPVEIAQPEAAPSKATDKLKQQLAEARAEVKSLKVARDQVADLEKAKGKLEQDNAELKKKLAAKEAKRGGKNDESAQELERLRSRVAALEASPVPYTPEEQALIKGQTTPKEAIVKVAAAPAPVGPKKGVHSVKDLPPGAGTMMAEAQRSFVTGDYTTAEKKYLEVLRQDDKNVYVLSHLANAQLAMNHLEDCEKNVKTSLSIDPDDAASLFLLGNLRLRQEKVDEAMDALSRSATINPTNAVTQNSLGSALSRKGLDKAAETAFRKAIQLDPGMPEAHHNLAIVYATQKPPSMELARWHYKKAVDLGQPKNPELEKILNATGK